MSIFRILNNQRGSLTLIFVVIVAIGGTGAVVLGSKLKSLAERVQSSNNQAILAAGDLTIPQPSNEEIQADKDAIPLIGDLALATGGLVNAVASLPSGGTSDLLGTGIATVADIIQSKYVSRGSNPAPTTSNPLPPDVHASVAVCDNDNLELCNSSNCNAAGGGYWYNDWCNYNPEDTCDNDHLYLCERNTCSGAGGYWYNNRCNYNPEDTTASLNSTTILGSWSYAGYRPDGVRRSGTMNFYSGNTFSYTLVDADGQSNGSGAGSWTLSGSTLTLSAALRGTSTISGDPTTFTYRGHGSFVFTR